MFHKLAPAAPHQVTSMQGVVKYGLIALPFSFALFFGLFFGLDYPEIVRHGWPLTRCNILDSKIDSRYCCEQQCHDGCSDAPSGAPTCSSQVSFLNNKFSPSQCAANGTACASTGQPCDGGYYCCSTCCETCQSCTKKCSGKPSSCSTSCTNYPCNCNCCASIFHRSCVVQCSTCYAVNMSLIFWNIQNSPHNTTYGEDFGKNQASANSFYQKHLANSTSACHYNPKSLTEVSFDVSLTPWKLAITTIFGILPLFVNISILVALFLVIPAWTYVVRQTDRHKTTKITKYEPLVADEERMSIWKL